MKELKPKTQCVLYARKSTEEDDQQIMSIEAQLFELREYASRERIEIVKVFTEAKSAKKPGRDEFAKMIEYIETSSEPLGIICWHPDRLARNSVDGGKIIYLVDTGAIASLRFPQFWFEPTPQGKFMLQVAFGQSKYFSDNLVENVKRGIRQKIRRGEWLTLAPFGYVNNLKTKNIEPDKVKSRIIKRAFEEYAKGTYTLKSLADFLAEHGLTQKKGTPLAKVSVVKMLTNRAYLGFVKFHGEYHDGNFEPILSPTLFEAVQKVLKSKQRPRKQKERYDFPFTQFARCGECGNMITAQYATNRFGTRYTYYRCTKKQGKCAQPYIQENALADQFQSLLQSVSLPLEEIEVMEKQINDWESESISSRGEIAQNLKSKLSETQEKLDRLVSLYLDSDIERDLYLTRKDTLLRQKAKLEESLGDFGQQGKNRLEPLRSFVLSLKEAEKVAQTKNYAEWRNFFRSLGSNPEIKDKTVSIRWGELWDFTASAVGGKGFGEKSSAFFAKQKTLHSLDSQKVTTGAFILPCSNLFPKLPKIKEVKGMRTRGARGGSKLCRTLDAKPCHRLASLGNPKKKNVLSIFRKNSPRAKSEKQGTFFFLGFCLPSIQAVWRGFNSDSVLRKLFSGDLDFRKTETNLFLDFVRAEEGSGEESARAFGFCFWRAIFSNHS